MTPAKASRPFSTAARRSSKASDFNSGGSFQERQDTPEILDGLHTDVRAEIDDQVIDTGIRKFLYLRRDLLVTSADRPVISDGLVILR